MSVYYASLLDNRNFLFKPIIEVVFLYIYLVDNIFYSVIVRNNINDSIIISRYLRLNTILEIDYNNCYLVTSKDIVNLFIVSTLKEAF